MSLEQQRAQFALAQVDSVKGGDDKAKYKTQLLKLPARLHNNGLGQTVAFYISAGADSPEWEICTWLKDWLHQRGIYGEQELIRSLTGQGVQGDAEAKYREASIEARALAVWLKRFAEAFIGDEEAQA